MIVNYRIFTEFYIIKSKACIGLRSHLVLCIDYIVLLTMEDDSRTMFYHWYLARSNLLCMVEKLFR